MHVYVITNDILVGCQKATQFPQQIVQAHETLRNKLNGKTKHVFYGISHANKNNQIEYYAAADGLHEDEIEQQGLQLRIIPAGRYAYLDVNNYTENTQEIARSFSALLQHAELDLNGFCLEHYLPNNVCRCMVKLIN